MNEMIDALINWAERFDTPVTQIVGLIGFLGIREILLSFISACVFYAVFSYRKDRKRKRMIIDNYRQQYKFFKQDMIVILLGICHGGADSDLTEKLQDIAEFKKHFKEPVSDSQDRWHYIMNNSSKRLDEMIVVISHFLQATDVLIIAGINFKNPDTYQFFHNLRGRLHDLTHTTAEYDDEKHFFRCLWGIFTGYSHVSGYADGDTIQKRIDSI